MPIAKLQGPVFSFQSQPIMLAVKTSRPHVVEFMLSIENLATAASLCLRDVQGSLPLHIAIRDGLVRITTSLLKSSEPRLLYTEDGVGITPLEIATLQHLLHLTRGNGKGEVEKVLTWQTPPKITSLVSDKISRHCDKVERPEIEAAETLLALVQSLDAEGRFTNKGLKEVLTDYAERTMRLARQPKEKEEGTPEPQTGLGFQMESFDTVGTLKLVKSVVGHSTRRELVHLLDAQRAVGNALDSATDQPHNYLGYEAGKGFGEEAAEKTQTKLGLMQILRIRNHLYLYEKAQR